MKKSILIAVIAFTISFSGLVFFLYSNNQSLAPQPVATQIVGLSDEEFDVEKDRLINILTDQDPGAALQALKEKSAEDSNVANACHDLVHVLGRAAFLKHKDFGIAAHYQDEMCVSGYIHGVLEAYFKSADNIDAALKNVCNNYPSKSITRWECYHGVGHGLMYSSNNDLPASLGKCDLYENSIDSSACYNGTFMENFNADQKDHISQYVDKDNPLYPCDQQTKNLPDCYMNLPIYYLSTHNNDYQGAMVACSKAPVDVRHFCYFGVGGQIARRNIGDQKVIEQLCSTSSVWREFCIKGVVGYYLQHYNANTNVFDLCKEFSMKNKLICMVEIAVSSARHPDI